MKTTNLQAPWRVIVSQYSNQKPSAWEITTRYGGVIAETNNLTNDTIPRLIAAAPDLLSALDSCLEIMIRAVGERLPINRGTECEETDWITAIRKARATIAKAEGVA
jgi:hypothetical protein